MGPRRRMLLFTVFAPLSVPLYVLFLAVTNVVGAAFYLVVEATVAKVLRRPISVSRGQMALLALPVLAATPLAAAIHLLLAAARGLLRTLRTVGFWQADLRQAGLATIAGAAWVLVAGWTTLACFHPGLGAAAIGRPITGRDVFLDFRTRNKALGEMPAELQARRNRILEQLRASREAMHPDWERLSDVLSNDHFPFAALPDTVQWRLAGMPWFFVPGEITPDDTDRIALLLGPLLLTWLLLVRWPGTFTVFRSAGGRAAWFVVRTAAGAAAVYGLVTWIPSTAYRGFWFEESGPPPWFYWLSPPAWLGLDYAAFVRPEWYLTSAAIWLGIVGVVIFIWWLAWRISPLLGWPRYYVAFLSTRLLQRKRIAFFSVGAVSLCVAMMIIVISVMGGFADTIRARAHGLLGDLVMDGDLRGYPYYQEFIDEISSWRDGQGRQVVEQATPLIHGYGILQFPDTQLTKPVRIWGVRLHEYVRVNQFGDDLFYDKRYGGTTLGRQGQPLYGYDRTGKPALPGEMDAHYEKYVASLPPVERKEELRRYARHPGEMFAGPGVFAMSTAPGDAPGIEGPDLPGVIIGRDILFERTPKGEYLRDDDYPRGAICYLALLPLTRTGNVSIESPPKVAFRYADDSRTGIHEIDSINVYVDFDELQRLLDMQPMPLAEGPGESAARCGQIQIKFIPSIGDDKPRLLAMKKRVVAAWRRYAEDRPRDGLEYSMMRHVVVQTWEEMQAAFISAIEKEKVLVLIMFGVISVVAVFLILCIFYMIVQEKTRDIGIVKSIGGSTEGVAAVFLAYGAAIGVVGSIVGSLLGVTFVEHINDVQEWLARLNPAWRVWSADMYSFDRIPDAWKWSEVIGISILAVLSSLIGAAFPAVRAGRTWPVDALRYE